MIAIFWDASLCSLIKYSDNDRILPNHTASHLRTQLS